MYQPGTEGLDNKLRELSPAQRTLHRNTKQEIVHRRMMIVAHLEGHVLGGGREGVCEGKRVCVALVEGLESLNFRPTPFRHLYRPEYEVWLKAYREDEKWCCLAEGEVVATLRIWNQ